MTRLLKIWGLVLLIFVGCKSTEAPSVHLIQKPVKQIQNNAKDSKNYSLELIPNSFFEVKTDPFGNMYPKISKGKNLLLKYTFKKDYNLNIQDAGYTEILYAELKNPLENLELKNEDLSKIKLYFGRLCFCPGETGYYPVTTGQFNLGILEKNKIQITINFKIKQVPQVINHLSEILILE